jgi:response regulator RpfG family c-di-GMP phosphodiesterase
MNDAKVLFVDDDENILAAFQRNLRKQFQIDTASGGQPGLDAIQNRGPYAVVVSDMRMPGMDGIDFLSRVKSNAPETVRIMLTGNGDLQTAVKAVNEGSIFRFMTKPCSTEAFAETISAGLQQHRLITSEREILEKTLSGSVRMLTEILSLIDPRSFGRAEILRDNVRMVANELQVENLWELEMAALTSRLGMVTVPGPVASKLRNSLMLTPAEQEMIARVPEIGSNLLANIPRLEPVAKAVLYQNKNFDGTGFPQDAVAGAAIPLGARILKVVSDLLLLEQKRLSRSEALRLMQTREGRYDPEVLDAAVSSLAPLVETEGESAPVRTRECYLADLRPGDVLASSMKTTDGRILMAEGRRLTETALLRIRNIIEYSNIQEPIIVEDRRPR